MPFRLSHLVFLLLPLSAGCVSLPRRGESRLPPERADRVVVVADGAGGRATCCEALCDAAEPRPMHVRSFAWAHWYGPGLFDVTDAGHATRQGARLADEVREMLARAPSRPVSLVGYSAGCAVVLAAAERLPADSLDKVVLLAPAASPRHDLRPTLASARRGVEVFTSQNDWVYLGLGTRFAGMPDGGRGRAAGLIGFRPPAEKALAARLRQYRWDESLAWSGNDGGHAGAVAPEFLRAYVVPLLDR